MLQKYKIERSSVGSHLTHIHMQQMPLPWYLSNWIKISVVKPVFKNGDRFNICLLTSFS